jgi:uncharacterized protein DUF3108
MASVARVGAMRGLAAFLPALLLWLGIAGAGAVAGEPWPHEVQAIYKVHFNGFELGTVTFNATVQAQTYTLSGDAQLSALLGVLQWRGETRTAGTLAGDSPRPAGYAFDFNGIGKRGSVRMNFAGDTVAKVSHTPPIPDEPDFVPVREQHLKGVLDPLSAFMALSRSASSSNPCSRTISVFDGRQRFDLTLALSRQERISEVRPSGQPGIAFVCSVRYVPIAGYRMTEETQHMATTPGLEVSLRPVPSADLFIPYQITIPTIAGSATLTAHWVQITTQRKGQIALVY